MVICLERGADLHMAQLKPLPLTVSCFSKIQIGFTLLVPAHLGSPGKRAVKRVWVCVCAGVRACVCVDQQRRDCDLNPGPSAPESSTLTTRLLSQPCLVTSVILLT